MMKMKRVIKATLMAGIISGMVMSVVPVFAAGPQSGRNAQPAWRQNCIRTQTQVYNRARLRDGSCLYANQIGAGSAQKRGNTYGPGDGTGNAGSGPKDGTGYGATPKN
jgi:hypothetical protein